MNKSDLLQIISEEVSQVLLEKKKKKKSKKRKLTSKPSSETSLRDWFKKKELVLLSATKWTKQSLLPLLTDIHIPLIKKL